MEGILANETSNGQAASVLLVDDSEHDRRLFRRTLEKSGENYEIEERPDAESALELLRARRFDVAIVDLHMPGIDGIELVRRAKGLLNDTAVIMLTGSRSVESAAEAVRLQLSDYLFKDPAEELREALPVRVKLAARQVALIRENRRLEAELRLRLARLEQIHRLMPEALFATLTRQGEALEVNEQAREFLGLGAEERLAGRPIEALLRGFSPTLADSLGDLLAKGAEARGVYIEAADSPEGERLFLADLREFTGAPADEDGPAAGWLLMLRDVTPSRSKGSGEMSHSFQGIIGRDPAILGICELIRRVAPMPTSVLITGPTGAGKEVIAKAIHAESDRKDKPFIPVNCTALSKEILESELFGHVKGAFTGAMAARKGRFREADGGTLFLDEIGDTTESFQTKLLRALDSGQIEPVGQDRPVKVDVRIICATNKDLAKLVREGKFREDLFYRINVVHLQAPPLADRPGDLPILIERFRQEFNLKFRKSIRFITQDAMRALAEHSWPGNVRELRHVLERAFVVAEGPTLTRADFPPSITGAGTTQVSGGSGGAAAQGGLANHEGAALEAPGAGEDRAEAATAGRGLAPALAEPDRIRATLAECGGNIGQAAEALSMHRTTLWRKMKHYGIEG